MKWGHPFDPDAEAIWTPGLLVGPTGERRDVLLLLHPGTPETIVEQALARQIGLDRSASLGPARFRGFSGPQDGYYATASAISVFGRSVSPFRIACCPFDEDFQIDGVLGLDFLRRLVVTLDFKSGRITLED